MSQIDLNSISYPVFKLHDKPNVDEGIIYFYSEIEKGGVSLACIEIVDDTSVKGNSLASRRLNLLASGATLAKLSKAIFFLGDLIKLANPQTYFIDSNGKLFNYKKEKRAKLLFHKITKVIPIPTGGAIIQVDGVPSRFKVLHMPSQEVKCAGILHTGLSRILYGLYDTIPENTRRMI